MERDTMKFQRTLSVSAFCALLAAMSLAVAQTGRVDPLDSARWGDMHHSVLADAPFEFDDRVRVIAPTTAENPMQVPVTVDATALPGVEEVLVFADFNPIVRVLRFFPRRRRPSWASGSSCSNPPRCAPRPAPPTAAGMWAAPG
jgi:sulfur-oxidizing protein SoxY